MEKEMTKEINFHYILIAFALIYFIVLLIQEEALKGNTVIAEWKKGFFRICIKTKTTKANKGTTQ